VLVLVHFSFIIAEVEADSEGRRFDQSGSKSSKQERGIFADWPNLEIIWHYLLIRADRNSLPSGDQQSNGDYYENFRRRRNGTGWR
jgi:hypothetical protein